MYLRKRESMVAQTPGGGWAMTNKDLELADASYLNDEIIHTHPARLVYDQWLSDESDQLIVYGFFRLCHMEQPLPYEINRFIALYYTKNATRDELIALIKPKAHEVIVINEGRKKRNTERLDNCCRSVGIFNIVILLLVLLCSPDIAALVIASRNDCDLLFGFGVTEFLFMQSIVHIGLYTCGTICTLAAWPYCGNKHCGIGLLSISAPVLTLLFVSLNIYGTILYGDMDTNMYRECANVMISVIVIRFVECVLMCLLPCVGLWWIGFTL